MVGKFTNKYFPNKHTEESENFPVTKHIYARFDFFSWQDGLVVNLALLVAGFLLYRLYVRTVKFIGRRW